MADDIDKLIAWACSQGWEVRIDAHGYRRFYTPDATYVTRHPEQPSAASARCAHRSPGPRAGVATTVEEGATRPAREGAATVSQWTAQITIQTPNPLDEPALVALAVAADEREATVAHQSRVPWLHRHRGAASRRAADRC